MAQVKIHRSLEEISKVEWATEWYIACSIRLGFVNIDDQLSTAAKDWPDVNLNQLEINSGWGF